VKETFKRIRSLAGPHLCTRNNDIHTDIAIKFGFKLLEKEGGDKDVVIPALILHDVGWEIVPKERQSLAFGPKIKSPELLRMHELEGAKIAKEILEKLNYDRDKTKEILKIIDGHDSREKSISLNDRIVKDADKLYRYSKAGLRIDCGRFALTLKEGIELVTSNLDKWFFTNSAKEIAREEIKTRLRESATDQNQ
jgi:HD superfamily phosphodiesterase